PGLKTYLAIGWTIEMDNYMRLLALSGKINTIDLFEPAEKELIGESIWNYFFLNYEIFDFQSLITQVRLQKNYREAFEISTGTTFEEFINGWRTYYNKMASDLKYDYEMLPDSNNVTSGKHTIS